MKQIVILSSKAHGVSIIEVLVSVSLLAILTTLALPSVTGWMNKTTINAVRETLVQDIRLMRSHSNMRRLPAYLCALDYEDKCSANNNWNMGWIGYIDSNDNHHFDKEETVPLIRKNTKLGSINIYLHNLQKYIKFNSMGTIVTGGHFRVCDPDIKGKQTMRLIKMNSMGRLAIETDERECN